MKHHLSSFRRSTALRVLCILILTVMCAPMAMAASITPAGPTLASVGGFNPLMIAGVVGGLGCMGLMSKAGDEGGENGGGGKAADEPLDVEAAMADIEDKTIPITKRLGIAQRIGVAFKTLQGQAPAEQFTQVKADLATAQSALATANADLVTARSRISALEADVSSLEQANADLEQANKDLQAKEQDLDKRASAQAKQIARSVGIEANKLPASQTGDEAQPTAEDRIRELTGSKRTEAALFYKQHKKLPEWMN